MSQLDQTVRYTIRLAGSVDATLADWYDAMQLARDCDAAGRPITTLTGAVAEPGRTGRAGAAPAQPGAGAAGGGARATRGCLKSLTTKTQRARRCTKQHEATRSNTQKCHRQALLCASLCSWQVSLRLLFRRLLHAVEGERRSTMKPWVTVTVLSCLIALLALVAAGAGLFWPNPHALPVHDGARRHGADVRAGVVRRGLRL